MSNQETLEKLHKEYAEKVTVLEHYDTCRRCAFIKAMEELEKQ